MKKFLSVIVLAIFILPSVLLLSACGELKGLTNTTLIFSKVEVTGTVSKEDYESSYKNMSFSFTENKMTQVDGSNSETWTYKLENQKVYIKTDYDEDYEEFATLSGKFMVVKETLSSGTATIYFKVK